MTDARVWRRIWSRADGRERVAIESRIVEDLAHARERYEVIRRLAVGGMGEVFLARQAIAGVNRLVALKRLLPGMAEDAELLAMFIDEARIAANLAHPGIVQVHEFGEDAQGFFIVMEYVAGHHVGQLITRALRRRKPIAIRLGAFIVHEVARALDHAHQARDSDGAPLEIVHRDISPSNVLVSFRGDVKLMDFGVARAANRGHRTNDGSIRGKFAYMAPEQIESKVIDARSDVFAVGIVLWELTLGRRLFTGPSDFETIRATLEQPIPRPRSIDPYYPPALEELVMAALERVHERRLASAAELAAGLKAYLRANPTDRDDLAALMLELFPDDAAAAEQLDDLATPPPAAATVMLPGPASEPPAPEIAVERHRSPRRVRWILPALALLAVGGVVAWRAIPPPAPPARGSLAGAATTAPADAAATTAPADAAATAVALPSAATAALTPRVDAAVVTPPTGPAPGGATRLRASSADPPRRHEPRPPARRAEPAVAVAALVAPPAVELGALSLAGPSGVAIRVDGPPPCALHSVPMRCHLALGQAYEFRFRVSGGATFTAALHAGAPLRRYQVDPAREAVDCVDGC